MTDPYGYGQPRPSDDYRSYSPPPPPSRSGGDQLFERATGLGILLAFAIGALYLIAGVLQLLGILLADLFGWAAPRF
ncbi:MAG: hypothetical protein ACXVI6_08765 [Candidatus Aminicenantales bacterium]